MNLQILRLHSLLVLLNLVICIGCTKTSSSNNGNINLNDSLRSSGYISYDLPAGFNDGSFINISTVGDSGYIMGGNLNTYKDSAIDSSASSWIIAKIDNSGNLVADFNSGAPLSLDFDDGTITTSSFGAVLGTTNDGPIYLAGNIIVNSVAQGIVVKLNSDGSLDSTWGDGGKLVISASGAYLELKSIALDSSNEKILVSGKLYNINPPRPVIYRVNSNGTLDSSFGNSNGLSFVELSNLSGSSTSMGHKLISIGADGFYLAGSTLGGVLAKFTSSGILKNDFGSSGVARTSSTSPNYTWKGLEVMDNGDILVAGSDQNSQATMSKYDSSGNLVASFGSNGTVSFLLSSTFQGSPKIDSQGRILSAFKLLEGADDSTFGIARFSSSGTLDTTYPIKPFNSVTKREIFDIQVLPNDSAFGIGYLSNDSTGERLPTLFYFASQ